MSFFGVLPHLCKGIVCGLYDMTAFRHVLEKHSYVNHIYLMASVLMMNFTLPSLPSASPEKL